jgi:hypothetical protein
VRITKPLIGTAVGSAVLGASLALGVSMASASTSSAAASHKSPAATSATPAASPAPKASTAPGPMPGRKCTHMSGSARSPAGVPTAN